MILLDYNPKKHKEIVQACVYALKLGKVAVFPTDTSYGLAADATNERAMKKIYQIKERNSHQPIHVVVPSVVYAKRISQWNAAATKLAKKFWPGAISLVLPLKDKSLKILAAGTGTIGLRCPDNKIALDLARGLGAPITATSANPSQHLSGGYDSYSAADILKQFRHQKHKPDIIINAGKLSKIKPSTILQINGSSWQILRPGPVSKKQVQAVLG